MIRIAIVDDERQFREELAGFVRRYTDEHGLSAEILSYGNGLDFTEALESSEGRFDIVFMDIKMPYVNGLSAAKRLRESDPYAVLIFTTVMMQYAARGYEVDALDYMVKPFGYLNLSLKMDKAVALVDGNRTILALPGEDGTPVRVRSTDIYYVESQDHYCVYHTAMGTFRKLETLASVQDLFTGEGFLRCSHSHLVNPKHVTGVGRNDILVHGASIPVSRRKHKEFMQEISKYF
ncbi:MAG: response regulator transcription factor [Lachnospiraceae bacterium]|nr:response regulator transcription factor [Lachnospiraceae bacterium]